MDKNLGTIIKIKQDGMIKAFEQNNMQITFVDNFEQLHNYLKKYLCNCSKLSTKVICILLDRKSVV